MASMNQQIATALIKTKLGLTSVEISDELQLKPSVIGMAMAKLYKDGIVEKGDYLEGEGQLWTITEKGIEKFASKDDVVEVKANVQVEPVIKQTTATKKEVIQKSEIVVEDFETRAPFSKAEIDLMEMPKQAKVNPDNFKVWEMLDRFGEEFSKLLNEKPKLIVENKEYKIKTLESLSELYNTKIGKTLKDIAQDLRG